MLNYFTVNTTAEILCFLVALSYLIKDTSLVWKSFILYLFIVSVTELIGIYIKKQVHVSNAWLYNFEMLVELVFISLMYVNLFNKYNQIKFVILAGAILVASVWLYDVLTHGIYIYNNLSYTIMSVINVLYAMLYYYMLLKNDDYIHLGKSGGFWWVTGALFFYFGSTACNLFYDKLLIEITPHHYLTAYIYNGLNIILYGCWSYSFICRRWLTTTSQSLS